MRASDQDRDSAASILSEAYAAGRLSREGFDERTGAEYSARTFGELRDLTADLPLPAAGTLLPSDTAASHGMSWCARRLVLAQMVWIYFVVLIAGLAGLIITGVWVTAVLIPPVLLLPPVLGISRLCRGPLETRPGRPAGQSTPAAQVRPWARGRKDQ
jgi:hypothetical protein